MRFLILAVSIFIAQNTLELQKTKMLPITQVYCTFLILLLTSESLIEALSWMSSFFRDPIWQFLGTVVGTAVAIYFGLPALQRKKISYKIISNENVLDINPEFRQDIKVTFREKLIKDLVLIIIKFTNTGNVPILEKDYAVPLAVEFDESIKIFASEITDEYPANLGATDKLQFVPNSSSNSKFVLIHPLLLNQKDSFTVRILADSGKFSISGRIAGIQKIECDTMRFEYEFWLSLLMAGFLVLVFLFKMFTVGGALNAFLAITFTLGLIGIIRKKFAESPNS